MAAEPDTGPEVLREQEMFLLFLEILEILEMCFNVTSVTPEQGDPCPFDNGRPAPLPPLRLKSIDGSVNHRSSPGWGGGVTGWLLDICS